MLATARSPTAVGLILMSLAFATLVAASAAEAQPAGKVYRVGYMGATSLSLELNLVEAFRTGLRDLGYVEGQNIVIDLRTAKSLGLSIPSSLLHRADRRIE